MNMTRLEFLRSIAAMPLLGFLKPSSEDAMDAAAARKALAEPERFTEREAMSILETDCIPTCGTFTYTIHHSDGTVEMRDGTLAWTGASQAGNRNSTTSRSPGGNRT